MSDVAKPSETAKKIKELVSGSSAPRVASTQTPLSSSHMSARSYPVTDSQLRSWHGESQASSSSNIRELSLVKSSCPMSVSKLSQLNGESWDRSKSFHESRVLETNSQFTNDQNCLKQISDTCLALPTLPPGITYSAPSTLPVAGNTHPSQRGKPSTILIQKTSRPSDRTVGKKDTSPYSNNKDGPTAQKTTRMNRDKHSTVQK